VGRAAVGRRVVTATFGVPRREIVTYEQVHLRLKLWRGRPDSMQCALLQTPDAREHVNATARRWRASRHGGTLTVGQAVEMTGLRYRRVADACRSGELIASQPTGATKGRWRIHPTDLEAWLETVRRSA